jgi:hypothetical protein
MLLAALTAASVVVLMPETPVMTTTVVKVIKDLQQQSCRRGSLTFDRSLVCTPYRSLTFPRPCLRIDDYTKQENIVRELKARDRLDY